MREPYIESSSPGLDVGFTHQGSGVRFYWVDEGFTHETSALDTPGLARLKLKP
jgi:hypothetical protein